jgi:transposase
MSMRAQPNLAIPEETQRVAQSAFPHGNFVTRIRDELGELYSDGLFDTLFPPRGQPAESPGRLALVTVLQFAEGLSDRQAADAVRGRIDWKYALGLDLTDPGFHYSVLSEFRARLLHGGMEQQLLDALLTVCRQRGWLKARGRQRTDSTQVVGAVRQMNRLELVGETLRYVLECLAIAAPEWLRSQVAVDWFERYGRRFENYRLPKEQAERDRLAERIGADGYALLAAVASPTAPEDLKKLECLQLLKQVWEQQFLLREGDEDSGTPAREKRPRLRSNGELSPGAELIFSPYDPEVRYSAKRSTEWLGYKVHLTETCDEAGPHLITHVATTPATTADNTMPEPIHAGLEARDLLPREHLMDAGYTDADAMVNAKVKGVDICGPVHVDTSWQAQASTGYDISRFRFDWQAQQVICPQGHISHTWIPIRNHHGAEAIEIRFAREDCEPCAARTLCTRAKSHMRMLQIRPQAQHEAIQQARQYQTTEPFQERYAKRAGIEGTISQGTRAFELRRTRYLGLAKTHLQHLATAAAINLARIYDTLLEVPTQLTRTSHFARLASA